VTLPGKIIGADREDGGGRGSPQGLAIRYGPPSRGDKVGDKLTARHP
jgi:hypothetical protein